MSVLVQPARLVKNNIGGAHHAINSYHFRKREGQRDYQWDGIQEAAQLLGGLYRGGAAAVLLRGRRGNEAEGGKDEGAELRTIKSSAIQEILKTI